MTSLVTGLGTGRDIAVQHPAGILRIGVEPEQQPAQVAQPGGDPLGGGDVRGRGRQVDLDAGLVAPAGGRVAVVVTERFQP